MTEPSTHRLAFFPHDSESASHYLELSELLLPTVEVLVFHGPQPDTDPSPHPSPSRSPSPSPASGAAGETADHALLALTDWTDRPLALFGDGDGAALAHAVAERLERSLSVVPSTLFVSGRTAPPPGRYQDDDPWCDLGGDPDDGDRGGLNCRVVAITSASAPEAALGAARAWGDCTRAQFDLETFPDEPLGTQTGRRQVANLIHDQLIIAAEAEQGWLGAP